MLQTIKPDRAMLGTSGHERVEHDFYPTPAHCTRAIAQALIKHGYLRPTAHVWEPACGDDKMGEVLAETFATVHRSDLYPKIDAPVVNFLTEEPDFGFDAIITNPPYSDVDDWIARCLWYVRNRGALAAMLMRHEIDCASTRQLSFDACPEFTARVMLTWRPRWIEGSTGSPRHNYTWFVWTPGDNRPAKNHYAFRRDCEG